MQYLAYGSNLSIRVFSSRIDKFNILNTNYELSGFKLVFNKLSKDGSAKANIVESKSDFVYCNIYKIDESEIKVLDKIEGYKYGYNKLFLNDNLFTYIADTNYIKNNIYPYDWYLYLILDGMLSCNFNKDYIENVYNSTLYIKDIDKDRSFKNYGKLLNFKQELVLSDNEFKFY